MRTDWHWQSEERRLPVDDQHRVMLAVDPLDVLLERGIDDCYGPLPAALKRPVLTLIKGGA